MGVPKFFRYISERYPCLSEVVREYQLPEFDNLYLDMNGIIHVCSHPNDNDPHFRITEEKIFKDIFHYIETLFRMIQPQKLFFMAVDGVAPRAKMNQQRGRRFRSAKEVEVAEAKATERGEALPSAERFDSNCITPGTEFMTRLQAQLQYFVTFKVSTDKLWRKVTVILSGHETPGEGEHKIMDYIRYMKSRPDYDPNTRHCLYGLDADLIMLGLCTHEPHFALLREEVKYGKKNNQKRIPTPEETTFFLLHLSLMREYLDLEFQELKTTLPFKYDLESVIDDWILMGFLVGNDFIPHLPGLHINQGALPLLYKTYTTVLPTLDGYLNEGGELKLDRFQKYMEKLAEFDLDQFKETSADLKYFEAKTGRKPGGKERHSYSNKEDPPVPTKNKDLAALIASTEEMLLSDDDDDENYTDIDTEDEEEDDTSKDEFTAMKQNYYREKMEYEDVTTEVMRSQSEGYITAIQWNLNYYYNGCCSWSWFFPHHYAPYISDIKNFADLKLQYDAGKPFLPFQQLLAVLPAASKKLLPEAYHSLMEDDKSPIISYYPKEFRTDLNGKKQDWEAVVLIPFIEQDTLLSAMSSKAHLLTEEERSRNHHGPMLVYRYTPEKQGSYLSPAYFPALANHHAKMVEVTRAELQVPPEFLIKGLCPGVMLDVYFPGFPTLRHLDFTGGLQFAKVKVFESPSREDNMILKLKESTLNQDVTKIAHQILGKSVYVNWPHLFEARVVCVSNEEKRFTWRQEDSTIVNEEMNKVLQAQWVLSEKGIRERYFERMGVDIGTTQVLVYACTLEDKKYVLNNGEMECQKQWSRYPTAYAYQTIKLDLVVHEPELAIVKTLDQLFVKDMTVFCLYPPYYGAKGTVLEVTEDQQVKVEFEVENEPSYDRNLVKKSGVQYSSGSTIAARLGLTSHLLSRVTGTIYVISGDIQQEAETRSFKLNIGLNLKFNKRNEEVCGFSRRDKNNFWWYSAKTEEEVRQYMQTFPEVFEVLRNTSENVHATDLYPEDTSNKLKVLGEWLKERDSNKAERQRCGAQVLDEEVVSMLENYMDMFLENMKKTTTTVATVKPHTLYIPKPKLGQCPDPRVLYQLFDRVVSVRECHTVPLGAKGTIIGVHDEDKGPAASYDVLFDKGFAGGLKLRCSPNRGFRLAGQALINIGYGRASAIKAQQFAQPTQISGTEDDTQSNFKHNSAFASWSTKPHGEGLSPVGGDEQKSKIFSQDLHGKTRHMPQQPQNSGSQQLSKEFFAMVKQLQGQNAPDKFMEPNNGKIDQSLALKQMLKIVDSSNKKLVLGPENGAFFQRKQENQENHTVSHCMELLSLHQRLGLPLPSYEYVDIGDRVACIIKCGDGKTYQGPPEYKKDQAAENSAGIALSQMKLGSIRPVMNNVPGQFHAQRRHPQQMNPPLRAGFAPPTNRLMGPNPNWNGEPTKPHNLPQPPTNWYTNTGNVYQHDLGRSGVARPVNPQLFPLFGPNQPGPPGHQPPYLPFNQGPPWQQSQQQQPPRAPFVPLQAESRKQNPEQQQRPHQQQPPSKPYEAPTPSAMRTNQPKEKQPPSGAMKTSKVKARPSKPRLAANFSTPFSFNPQSSNQK